MLPNRLPPQVVQVFIDFVVTLNYVLSRWTLVRVWDMYDAIYDTTLNRADVNILLRIGRMRCCLVTHR